MSRTLGYIFGELFVHVRLGRRVTRWLYAAHRRFRGGAS